MSAATRKKDRYESLVSWVEILAQTADEQEMADGARHFLKTAQDVVEQRAALLTACQSALEHIRELRDAWMRGALNESDSLGGTRSNRNIDVERTLSEALALATQEKA